MKLVTVYLAGSVGGPKHEVIKGIPKEDAVFVCSDGGNHSEHDFGISSYSWYQCNDGQQLRALVQEFSLGALEGCDFVFAYLERPGSYGTVAEIAFAVGEWGKPVLVVVLEPPKDELANILGIEDLHFALFDAYWFVSCLPGVIVLPVESRSEATGILRAAIHMAQHSAHLNLKKNFRVQNFRGIIAG